jgi:imidazolonepropionase
MAHRPHTAGLVIRSIGQLVTNDPEHGGPLGIVDDAAVAIVDGVIAWVGRDGALPEAYASLDELDGRGAAVLPGFVDAHTHVMFAGDRAGEFAMRADGASYVEILASGGGMRSTVAATRAASLDDLISQSLPRVERMLREGTTTVEIKTGYGLDVASERKILDAIVAIDDALPVDVVPTFLGAHVVGPEYASDRGGYVELVAGEMLDAVEGDVAFVDVFCDAAAFTIDETRTIARAAAARGIPVRIHADQLSHSGGAALAVELGAVAADHLDHATDADLAGLARAGTVAVLLPSVSFSMRMPPPDGRRFLDAGVTVAIATDCNPGTSYVTSMPFVIALAVASSGMTPAEAIWSATAGGAAALGLDDRGVVAPGRIGDLVVLDAPSFVHLAYRPDGELVRSVVKRGRVVAG